MPATITSANFAPLFLPGLRQVFFEEYLSYPQQYSDYLQVGSSKKQKETDYRIAGTGLWKPKNNMEPTTYEDIRPADSIEYIWTVFSQGVQLEREFIDDELYGVASEMTRDLAKTAQATVETEGAKVLNNGFTVNGYDGVPLFSDSHPLRGNAGGTRDNLVALALSDTNLKAALIQGRKQASTEAGIKMVVKFDGLFVTPDLEFLAKTLMQSMQVPGGNFNDSNVIKGSLTVAVLDYLDELYPNRWYLRASKTAKAKLFWRIHPEYNSEKSFDNGVTKFQGYMRFGTGYSDWRGWLGSNP